jgi:hypothetical protein
MAPKAKIVSGTFYDDLDKLESVASRIQVSNHSYGPSAGWGLKGLSDGSTAWVWYGDVNKSDKEDVMFGRYTSDCVRFDGIMASNPFLTSVVAAGNDRNDEPDFQPIEHLEIRYDAGEFKWVRSSDIRAKDGGKSGGVDTLSGLSTCKNSLGVGAINDQFDDGVALEAKITTTVFSSWGPTDDGRIKPEVVANGQELLSATIPPVGAQKPDEVYDSMSGTSMASPTAAGIVAILAEYYRAQHGSQPTSAMMRALLAHSATDAGLRGPDAVYGYGSINAFRAGELIRAADGALILEQRIESGKKYSLNARSNGRPIRVALAWIDPPGRAAAGPINDSTPVLVNDLDLSLVSPAGVTHFPYSLDVSSPTTPATATRANRVDNLEIIDAPIAAGVWRIEIAAPVLKAVGAGQAYSLVISGLSPDPGVVHP